MPRRVREIVGECGGGYACVEKIYTRFVEGEIRLIPPYFPRSYISYLLDPAFSLDTYIVASILALFIASTMLGLAPLSIPAYILVAAYYSGKYVYETIESLASLSLRPLPRLLMIIGVSLVVSPAIYLATHYAQPGDTAYPIVLAAFTAISYLVSTYIRYRKERMLYKKEKPGPRQINITNTDNKNTGSRPP